MGKLLQLLGKIMEKIGKDHLRCVTTQTILRLSGQNDLTTNNPKMGA